jgi:hypothetical protein
MMIEPCYIRQGPPAVLGRCGLLTPNADRIDMPWRQGEEGCEAKIACPIRHAVVHVPAPFTTMATQVTLHDVPRLGTTIRSAVNIEALQMLITPSTHALQDRLDVPQCGVAADEEAAPDEGADAS